MKLAFALAALSGFALIGLGQSGLEGYKAALKENPKSSLAHYGIGDTYFQEHSYQAAANEFRNALQGDLQPAWTVVWSHIGLGKIFDVTGQRTRAVEQYNLAIQTKDDTRGALQEAEKYLKAPYQP